MQKETGQTCLYFPKSLYYVWRSLFKQHLQTNKLFSNSFLASSLPFQSIFFLPQEGRTIELRECSPNHKVGKLAFLRKQFLVYVFLYFKSCILYILRMYGAINRMAFHTLAIIPLKFDPLIFFF